MAWLMLFKDLEVNKSCFLLRSFFFAVLKRMRKTSRSSMRSSKREFNRKMGGPSTGRRKRQRHRFVLVSILISSGSSAKLPANPAVVLSCSFNCTRDEHYILHLNQAREKNELNSDVDRKKECEIGFTCWFSATKNEKRKVKIHAFWQKKTLQILLDVFPNAFWQLSPVALEASSPHISVCNSSE